MAAHPRQELLALLRERLEQAESPADEAERCSSGCPALDRLLPRGGFRRGSLVEWCAAARGDGAGTLALLAAREACRAGGALVVLDRRREFYPPAAAAWGLDLDDLLLVRPREPAQELWALDQALRCPGVAAVWGAVGEMDDRTQRRLQLAAEEGRTLGLLLRPAHVRRQPSWADVRLLVRPVADGAPARRLRVEILRCRGGQAGGQVELSLDEARGAVSNRE